MGKKFTGEPTTATERFQKDASETKDAAVSQGQKSVDDTKALSREYVEQVKELARGAIETAQVWFLNLACGEWKLTTNVL
jgi:hypothetical protein